MRIYLDNCSFNRPFDNQGQLSVYLETQAKLNIQSKILYGEFMLVWSYILDYENAHNPYEHRKNTINSWKDIACDYVGETEELLTIAEDINNKGSKSKDSLHIACAIVSKCKYFITTDKGIIGKSKKISKINICNPIDFVMETEENIYDK